MYEMETGRNFLDSSQQAESIDSVRNFWKEVWFCGKKKGLLPRFIVNTTRKLNRFGPDAKASSNLKQEGWE